MWDDQLKCLQCLSSSHKNHNINSGGFTTTWVYEKKSKDPLFALELNKLDTTTVTKTYTAPLPLQKRKPRSFHALSLAKKSTVIMKNPTHGEFCFTML